jgi:tetratricopeptide (TPR) repeat protein
MRLLHFVDQRLALTDFSGRTIPPYAILSHRWNTEPNNEVLFQDVGNDTWKTKAGYPKIVFCAQQAARDRLQYFWIDTCCIDKWNRHELSKAVNSMFRWYQNAAKCYVFLPDIFASSTVKNTQQQSPPKVFNSHGADVGQQSAWELSFRASAWFARGWTLQELIAPASVEFFSSDGKRIGDKESLKQVIHEITSIPTDALQGYPLQGFSVYDRMAWLGNRKTSEPEDAAYCLLGILNISIPLNYGEGREKAFSRLREELQAIKDYPSIIPFSQNDQFVGQQAQLSEIEMKLFTDQHNTRIAITGEGGTGKSQLALEIAHRTRRKSKHCSVFWIDASGIDSLRQAYLVIAEKLSLPGWDDEKADIMELLKLHLSRKNAGQWLLVFDNVDNVDLASTELSTPRSANLIDYLPQCELGSIIFTTTNSSVAKTLALQNIVKLQEMMPETAERMLKNHMINPALVNEKQEMQSLLRELSYLPLAIVQAAAYINMNDITLKEYRSRLRKQEEEALMLYSEGTTQTRDPGSPMTTTLLTSLDQIRHNHSLAAEYLFLMACIDRKDIPLDVLGADPVRKRDDAVRILNAYALVTRRPAENALDLHRLVHHTVQKWLQKQEWLEERSQEAIARLLEIFPNENHTNRSKWQRLLPHAKYVLSHGLVDQEDRVRTDLLWKCATALYSDGQYSESEHFIVRVIEARKRVLGEEHPDTLASMNNLASMFWNQGRWKEAEDLDVRVIETKKRVLGEEHPSTLISMANLALIYMNQGRWKKAEELYVRVIETKKRVLGEEHPDTLTSISNLALTFWNQGRWKEAEELDVRAIETRKRVLGDEHPDTLTSMVNLASTYRNQGRWKKAEELQAKELEICSRMLGEEHPSTLASIGNLASTYRNQGRWGEAEELEVRVMETFKRVLGEEHPSTLTSMANLASTYSNQGRWKEAEELQAKELEICSRVLGEEHPDTLTSIGNLALTYSNQGRWKEAEELQAKELEICSRVLGEEHPSTLTSMGNLALTVWNQGRWKEAEELYVRVIETRKRVLGEEHPSTLTSMGNLASTVWNQGRWKEAEELYVRVIETRKRVLGEEHPDTLTSIINLAFTFKGQNRHDDALKLITECLRLLKRILGDSHPYTITCSETVKSWTAN